MKLLCITATGLPLFRKGFKLTFYAKQRVDEQDRECLFPLGPFHKYYLNCANALIGINASGKTSTLKVILLALDILNNLPINFSESRDILGDTMEAILTINFVTDEGALCQLETHISSFQKSSVRLYHITEETLWVKPFFTATSKRQLIDFSGILPYATRTNEEDYLPSDVSIIIAFNRKFNLHVPVESLLSLTNTNILPVSDEISPDILRFLDPTIEYLSFERDSKKLSILLKFFGEREMVLSDSAELNRVLSSGTIKGIVTFTLAIQTLQSGGYLVIDELENHFNKEIAMTLLRFFMDASLNKHGGALIFSTHYPELLDAFQRNDCIYITRNQGGITIDNLADILNRNDIKKSDAYQSGFLGGTTPAYNAYMRLKKNIRAALIKEDDSHA